MSENSLTSPNPETIGCPFCGGEFDVLFSKSDNAPSYFLCKEPDCPSKKALLPFEDVKAFAQENQEAVRLLIELRKAKTSLRVQQEDIRLKQELLRSVKEGSKSIQGRHRDICSLWEKVKHLRVYNDSGEKNAPFEFQDPETGETARVISINSKRKAVARIGAIYFNSKDVVKKCAASIRVLKRQINWLKSELASFAETIEEIKNDERVRAHQTRVRAKVAEMMEEALF